MVFKESRNSKAQIWRKEGQKELNQKTKAGRLPESDMREFLFFFSFLFFYYKHPGMNVKQFEARLYEQSFIKDQAESCPRVHD